MDGRLASQSLTIGFNDAHTHGRLWGKLDDCLMLNDSRLAPLDHKTRASAPESPRYTERYYQLQMDVYTLLLERDHKPTTQTAYVIYYFPVDGTLHEGFPFGVLVHKIRTDPERAYRIFVEACRCLAGPMPEIGPHCAYCRWAEARPQGAVAIPEDLFA